MNELALSIVVPNYNSSEFIDNTIQSLLAAIKKIDASEVIVVDDCSTDDSVSKIKKYGDKVKLIELKENKGACYCRNLGAIQSKYDYLCFFDSDDSVYEHRFSVQLIHLIKNKLQVNFCFAHDEYGNVLGKYRKEYFPFSLLIGHTNIVSTGSMIVTRNIHEQIGGFNETLPRQQDIDYAIRLSEVVDIRPCRKPLFVKINSGSPSYLKVKKGYRFIHESFVKRMSFKHRRLVSGKYNLRLAELALKEFKIVFFKHLIFFIIQNPLAVTDKFGAYKTKFKKIVGI